MTGGFELADDKLLLSRIVATRMACPDGVEQEQLFLKSLGDVEHYRIDGNQLELLDRSG
ncbi:META domain-containing protein, partial [Escherichia coli]|uniref:META domain-containing protein n=1 Tax=Escherichia coli TaxID=562 RepID=UPI0034D28263